MKKKKKKKGECLFPGVKALARLQHPAPCRCLPPVHKKVGAVSHERGTPVNAERKHVPVAVNQEIERTSPPLLLRKLPPVFRNH